MKNKKLALFGLLYDHSFKKVILVLISYLFACLGLSFILFKTGYTNDDMTNTASFFNTIYFVILRKACFFFVIMYSIRASKIVLTNTNITKRLSLKERELRLTSLAYSIIILIMSFAVIIISTHACIRLELAYFDFAYYNKPFLFLSILGNSFRVKNYTNAFVPFYNGIEYAIRFVIVVLAHYAVIRAQSKHKIYRQEDIKFAAFVSIILL